MSFKIKNYRVIGKEVYGKTKLPISEQVVQKEKKGNVSIESSGSEQNKSSFEKAEKGIREFEDSFRHKYYVDTPRYVGK